MTGPVSLVLDLRIVHDRWGSSSDPKINGHLRYPNDSTLTKDTTLLSSLSLGVPVVWGTGTPEDRE
jgi:hypothetical protein